MTGPHRLTVRTPLFQGGDRSSILREGVFWERENAGTREREHVAGIAQFTFGDFAAAEATWARRLFGSLAALLRE
jgi:hypothetical protein